MGRPVVDPTAGSGSSTRLALPAPIGGWNARDSVALMAPTDAIFLDNFYPTQGACEVRPGRRIFATLPIGKEIKSLLGCSLRDGTTKTFAVAQDGVYEFSAGGSIAAAAYALTNGQVEHQNINVAGVNYLWCCVGDGTNKSFIYRSDTNVFQVIDGASVPVLTGVNSQDISNVFLWQNRMILVERNSLNWYYLGLNSVGGAASKVDMGSRMPLGGYLVAVSSWSVDAGNGPQERLVMISSEGEIAVFEGTDPSDATAFKLVGVYFAGRPMSKRCFQKVPGDLVVLTESGLWPMSKLLSSSILDPRAAVSDKIVNAFVSYAQEYGDQYGWQVMMHPPQQALMINVPLTTAISYQFVMNVGAPKKPWCRFVGWNSTALLSVGGTFYHSMGRFVYEGWTGTQDLAGGITAACKQAFLRPVKNAIGHVKLVRPILTADSNIQVKYGIATDFDTRTAFTSTKSFIQALSRWGSAVWGSALWGSGDQTIKSWVTVGNKPGSAFALEIKVVANGTTCSWSATDAIIEAGGILG